MEAFLEFRKKCKYREGNSCFYNVWDICSEETCPFFKTYIEEKTKEVEVDNNVWIMADIQF